METLITILVGVLVTVAVYLLLSRNLVRVILGTAILSHAVHLLLMTMGGLEKRAVSHNWAKMRKLYGCFPQALILTAIVISFAVTAFLLVLAYRTYKETGSDDLSALRGSKMNNIIVMPMIIPLLTGILLIFLRRLCESSTVVQS